MPIDINIPQNTNDLMAAIEDEEMFDTDFASSIEGVTADLSPMVAQLEDLDLTEEATKITSVISGGAVNQMSSFVQANISSVIDNANLHSAVSGIEGMLGQTGSGACPGLDKAFGPFLGGRSMLAAVDDLKTKIPALPSLSTELASAQHELQTAIEQEAAGAITPEQLAVIENNKNQAQEALDSAKNDIKDLVEEVKTVSDGVTESIADANAFVNKATAKLTNFAEALKVNALVKDPCMQSIIGAVGSPRMLGLI